MLTYFKDGPIPFYQTVWMEILCIAILLFRIILSNYFHKMVNKRDFLNVINLYVWLPKDQTISKATYGVLNSPKTTNEKSLSWVLPKEKMLKIVIFCSLFTINCFWDLLTFNIRTQIFYAWSTVHEGSGLFFMWSSTLLSLEKGFLR